MEEKDSEEGWKKGMNEWMMTSKDEVVEVVVSTDVDELRVGHDGERRRKRVASLSLTVVVCGLVAAAATSGCFVVVGG